MSTIPASQIADILPGVLSSGGDAIDLNGLILTTNPRIPIGTVKPFSSTAAVSSYFGAGDALSLAAPVYFNGYDGSTKKPGALLMVQYPLAAVSAYLRGGNVSALSLTALQAISGTLSITIDSVVKSGNVNLSAATSFSNAAQIIGDTLDIETALQASFTAAIAATTMTVSAVASGTLAVGQFVHGAGVTDGTYITALGSGTGGTGTYTVSVSQSVGSEALTTNSEGVTYDSVSGAFVINSGTTGGSSTTTFATGTTAAALKMTAATGALLSQGAAAATPAAFMASVIAQTQNWALFMTAFNPDNSGFANRLAFSAWANGTNNRYGYVPFDTQVSPLASVPDTTCFMYAVTQAGYSGTIPVWEPSDLDHSWFILGWAASLNFDQAAGRATLGFRTQSGLVAGVTDGQSAINLGGSPQVVGDQGNGYNFVGVYGSGNSDSVFVSRGFVSGPFKWADSFVNQIWLNNSLQVDVIDYFKTAGYTPFNAVGNGKIEQSLSDTIQQAISFGMITPGVTLSASQILAVNTAAGNDAASVLQTRGWYVQITPSSPDVRVSRGPVSITFWYVDGQSVQSISLSSINVQ